MRMRLSRQGRAYQSTRDRKFLQPYLLTGPKILPLTNDLKKLVADNPIQVARAVRSENGTIALLNYWQNLHRDTTRVASDQLHIIEQERQHLDTVHNRINEFTTEERALLVSRTALDTASVGKAMNMLIANTIFIMVVAVILMIVSFRELSSRMKIQQELRKRLKEVEDLNKLTEDNNWLLGQV